MSQEHPNQFALLGQRRFAPFFWTQFLGAANDNVFKFAFTLMITYQLQLDWLPPSMAGLVIGALFILPYVLFSATSGQLADKHDKAKLMQLVKSLEIAIMAIAAWGFYAAHVPTLLACVFLMGLHATVFSPAKYGIVPEILPGRDLSRGNALLEMSTFVAIVLGIGGGGVLFAVWRGVAWRIGIVTLAVSLAGFLSSLRIARVAPSGAKQAFPANPFADIAESTRHLLRDRALWLAVLGVCYFWFAGVLLKTDLQFFGLEALKASDRGVSLLWGFLAVGIGVGNLLAGRLSGDVGFAERRKAAGGAIAIRSVATAAGTRGAMRPRRACALLGALVPRRHLRDRSSHDTSRCRRRALRLGCAREPHKSPGRGQRHDGPGRAGGRGPADRGRTDRGGPPRRRRGRPRVAGARACRTDPAPQGRARPGHHGHRRRRGRSPDGAAG